MLTVAWLSRRRGSCRAPRASHPNHKESTLAGRPVCVWLSHLAKRVVRRIAHTLELDGPARKKRRAHLGDFDCVVFFRCEAQIEQSDQLAAERHQSGLVRCDCMRLHATQRLCFLHDCGGVDAGSMRTLASYVIIVRHQAFPSIPIHNLGGNNGCSSSAILRKNHNHPPSFLPQIGDSCVHAMTIF